MQKKSGEVTHANTTSQPKQHKNNANTKHKKPQAESAEVVHRKPNTTTNKKQNRISKAKQQFRAQQCCIKL
jgi:hypothetical protein